MHCPVEGGPIGAERQSRLRQSAHGYMPTIRAFAPFRQAMQTRGAPGPTGRAATREAHTRTKRSAEDHLDASRPPRDQMGQIFRAMWPSRLVALSTKV